MKKSKVLAAALAATMMVTSVMGLAACSKDSTAPGGETPSDGGKKTYTVTFNANGGTLADGATTKTATTNEFGKLTSEQFPTPTPPEGKEFSGWYTVQATTGGLKYTFNSKFSKNTDLYARYGNKQEQENPQGEGYTITFHANNGADPEQTSTLKTDPATNKVTGTAPTFEYAGHEFTGWADAAENGTAVDLATQEFTAADDLYAQWTAVQEEVGTEYILIGEKKVKLESVTSPDTAERYYTADDVALNEGETVQFYIDGEPITAWTASTWNGMQPASQKTDTFTAARTGNFDFTVGYYPKNESTGAEATWSVGADDGKVVATDYQVTLTDSNGGTLTLSFDFPSWAKDGPNIYIFKDGQPVASMAWPGVLMSKQSIDVGESVTGVSIIISFKDDSSVEKQSNDFALSNMTAGKSYCLSIGAWKDNKFDIVCKEVNA